MSFNFDMVQKLSFWHGSPLLDVPVLHNDPPFLEQLRTLHHEVLVLYIHMTKLHFDAQDSKSSPSVTKMRLILDECKQKLCKVAKNSGGSSSSGLNTATPPSAGSGPVPEPGVPQTDENWVKLTLPCFLGGAFALATFCSASYWVLLSAIAFDI